MNLIQKYLIDNKPAEKGGAIAEERLGYQKDWAICKLLELHKKESNYLMIFEYHDDIIILDNSEDPDLISFYQVKTKAKGTWTTNDLADKKKEMNSYLGKLWLHKIRFPKVKSTLNFVSNARYRINLINPIHKSIDYSNICIEDLSNSEKDLINTKLTSEFSSSANIEIKDTFFHVSNIPIQNSEMASISALVSYFEELDNNNHIPKIRPLHATLINEIRRKSKYTFEVSSFDELVKCRSFTRNDFHNILMHALKKSSVDLRDIQSKIHSRLDSERVSIRTMQHFAKNSNQYIIDKIDIMNEVIRRIESEIKKAINSLSDDEFDKQLLDCAELIYQRISLKKLNDYEIDKQYIITIILFEIYGNYEL